MEWKWGAEQFPNLPAHGIVARVIVRRNLWLASGFALGLALTGIPFWRQPYNADFLADLPLQLGFVGLAAVTAALSASGVARLAPIFWTMLAVFPTAVMLRVMVETAQDPTDHNLWPFELIFAGVFALVAVVPGLLIGALVRRVRT